MNPFNLDRSINATLVLTGCLTNNPAPNRFVISVDSEEFDFTPEPGHPVDIRTFRRGSGKAPPVS